MRKVQNIGPFGRTWRGAAGLVSAGVAVYALVTARRRDRRAAALLAGAAATSAFTAITEARRQLCVAHALLGRQSSESLRTRGRLSLREKRSARRVAVRILTAAAPFGLVAAAAAFALATSGRG
jgi:hypothetical protein